MAREWAKKFYTSAAWRRVRREALRREMFTCAICCGQAQEVHHINELTPLNINEPSVALNLNNLVSLCHNCHNSITKKSAEQDYFFDEYGQYVRRAPRGDAKK